MTITRPSLSAGTSAPPGGPQADWWGPEPGGEGSVWEGDQGDQHTERDQQPLLGRGTSDMFDWLN